MASLSEIEAGDKKFKDVLDLSMINISNKLELKKLLERIPDFKVRSERVRAEDLCVEDEFAVGVSEKYSSKLTLPEYQFANPVPPSLREVCLKELGRVNISWRMLTLARPKTKLDEDFFSRLVQLEKLQHRTIQWEMEKEAIKEKKASLPTFLVKGKGSSSGGRGPSRGSAVSETRLQTCKECGVEFCVGACKNYLYEDCTRTFNPITEDIFEIVRKTGKPKKEANSSALKKESNSGKVQEKGVPDGKKTLAEPQPSNSGVGLNPQSASDRKRTTKGKSRRNKTSNPTKK